MILQALHDYYHRLAEDPNVSIPPPGFAPQKISFCLVLDQKGNLLQVRDLREASGKPKNWVVPSLGKKRASGIEPNFLWDKTDYVLGACSPEENEKDKEKKKKRALDCWEAFKKLHHELGNGLDDEGMAALLAFLDSWDPNKAAELEYWDEMAGTNLVFQLDGELNFLHEYSILKRVWSNYWIQSTKHQARCLVTGKVASVAQLHPVIKGIMKKEAPLVSFNLESSKSYGKEQSLNAPVTKAIAFTYTTALNHLLARESRQKVTIGDATTVFWTEKPSLVEDLLADLFAGKWEKEEQNAEDPGLKADLRLFLEAIRDGKQPHGIDPTVPFFILGLAPNASRLAVRFWHASTVGEMQERIGRHFRDLAIQRNYPDEPEFPGMWQLLVETAVQRKTDNINPSLAGAFMRAILTGSPYPQSLLSAVVGRTRADQTVNYFRAAMIKACLVRKFRILNHYPMEVTMSLNKESTNTAYLLGRLFAVLEKAQRDALGQTVNATIRDRYYSSASTTPAAVFPLLIRLA
ncbi:MAG: type I-C CRISPR-associated protein Cas8c/Csd1, partial [Deltaproteobacteria bacterium]